MIAMRYLLPTLSLSLSVIACGTESRGHGGGAEPGNGGAAGAGAGDAQGEGAAAGEATGGEAEAAEAGEQGGGEGEGEVQEVVDPFGDSHWKEKLVEKVFVQPDCTSAKRQRAVCDPWLTEERNKIGDRWRVGFCEIERRPLNDPRSAPPPDWGCKLRGRYVKLVADDDEQQRMQEWDLTRMYEGRDCEFLDSDEGKAAKRDCEAWIELAKDSLSEHVLVAQCQNETFTAASGVNPCRYVARIKWLGYPIAQ